MILKENNIVEFYVGESEAKYPYTFQAKIISYDPVENIAVVETNEGEQTLDLQAINYAYTLVHADDPADIDLDTLTPEQIEQIRKIINASD